jgi:hypothetical protein
MGRKNSNAAAKKAHLDAQTELLLAKSLFWREMSRLIGALNDAFGERKGEDPKMEATETETEREEEGESTPVDAILGTVGKVLKRHGVEAG